MLIIRIKSYYQNKSEISVCLTYSKLAKTAYKSVGGLYSCSDIFDFELLFLAESTLQRISSAASVYLPCAIRLFFKRISDCSTSLYSSLERYK